VADTTTLAHLGNRMLVCHPLRETSAASNVGLNKEHGMVGRQPFGYSFSCIILCQHFEHGWSGPFCSAAARAASRLAMKSSPNWIGRPHHPNLPKAVSCLKTCLTSSLNWRIVFS